ncbi:MAG: DEAD/DEAH box helicase [Candidatus Thorarchaeota archaeon]|nr:DEAD/DEAH box helicase [Candidatus Thorarchaeota archaeon]
MPTLRKEDEDLSSMRDQLKALSNRHAMEILQVLSPQTGEIVPTLGWDSIVEGMLALDGINKPLPKSKSERTQTLADYESLRQSLMSGGTIYETMNKLIRSGFVISTGDKGRKQRGFMITHEGRLALAAIAKLSGPVGTGTDVQRAAKILLKHKNFVSLLPAQEKFVQEIGDVDSNLVIQMPPGSGKTFLAMIVILLRLQKGVRCLYLSPYTSLSRQIVEEYGTLLQELGYSVVRYDGLSRVSESELENGNLIIAMYESFSTAMLQKKKWTENLGLAIVDELTELDSNTAVEAYTLGTDRSTKLDSVITLLKEQTQIVTLSSRFGETEEVSAWLDAKVFRPSVRLVPDEFIVNKAKDQFDIVSSDGTQRASSSEDDVLDVVMDHLGDYQNKSILVVVGSRYRAQGVARRLARSHPRIVKQDVVERVIGLGENLPLSNRLADTLKFGAAFHHSGVDAGVRERLEREIRNKKIRTVVSTTGITSGISFPFDCVVILLNQSLYYLETRARYLQVAGRIGENHLAQHGGRVYLVFEGPNRNMPNSQAMEEKLLHRPLQPLRPGILYPSLAISILTRNTVNGKKFTQDQLRTLFQDYVNNTYRGTIDNDYRSGMKKFFKTLFNWLVKQGVFEEVESGFKLSKDARSAVRANLDTSDYLRIKSKLARIDDDSDESALIDLLLQTQLPQYLRPPTFMPSKMELKLMGLEPPEDWYVQRLPERNDVKRTVLESWLDEQDVTTILKNAAEKARGINLDEGDLNYLLGFCSQVAESISQFLRTTKKSSLSKRMNVLSRQLQYGVRKDLADADLLELRLLPGDDSPSGRLSRSTARTLYEKGYTSISDVVKKDLGASKEGYARDRFAKNCGLEPDLAKEVYKAALAQIRAKFDEED